MSPYFVVKALCCLSCSVSALRGKKFSDSYQGLRGHADINKPLSDLMLSDKGGNQALTFSANTKSLSNDGEGIMKNNGLFLPPTASPSYEETEKEGHFIHFLYELFEGFIHEKSGSHIPEESTPHISEESGSLMEVFFMMVMSYIVYCFRLCQGNRTEQGTIAENTPLLPVIPEQNRVPRSEERRAGTEEYILIGYPR